MLKYVLMLLLLSGVLQSNAQTKETEHGDRGIEITYEGSDEESMMIKVNFQNTKKEIYIIAIRDQDHEYYMETYRGINYMKVFKMPAKEGIMVTVRNPASKYKATFVTKKTFQISYDYTLTKVR